MIFNPLAEVDQLTKTLEITGSPEPELLEKLTSDEVNLSGN
jgi:hypothetical protein